MQAAYELALFYNEPGPDECPGRLSKGGSDASDRSVHPCIESCVCGAELNKKWMKRAAELGWPAAQWEMQKAYLASFFFSS